MLAAKGAAQESVGLRSGFRRVFGLQSLPLGEQGVHDVLPQPLRGEHDGGGAEGEDLPADVLVIEGVVMDGERVGIVCLVVRGFLVIGSEEAEGAVDGIGGAALPKRRGIFPLYPPGRLLPGTVSPRGSRNSP